MAVIDVARKLVTIKIVYYGCALGGKTTNLITLHRLTDPDENNGLVSIATQDDRTLFFDLLPMELGTIGGLSVRVKIYTVPGQVHYELTRRQVLAGADGVVQVIDSDPEVRKSNAWAMENLRFNLRANGFNPDKIPIVVQWNKRDLPNARPVQELEDELNPKGLPSREAIATQGHGVVETFAEVVKRSIVSVYAKSGKASSASEKSIRETVDKALADAKAREPKWPEGTPEARTTFEHRVDMEAYRDRWAEQGRDRQIMDQETLLTEAVQTGMELAERLEGFNQIKELSERRRTMMEAMGNVAPALADPSGSPIPDGMMAMLAEACRRTRGSILLFRQGHSTMEERQVVGAERDPLNAIEAEGIGSPAFGLCRTDCPRTIDDLATEVFFDAVPPCADGVVSATIFPLACDGLAFGGVVVYVGIGESGLDVAEREFWSTAATFLGLSLHWRALRNKLTRAKAAS